MKFVQILFTTSNIHFFNVPSKGKSSAIVMGSDACKKHLDNISRHLTAFEKEPKDVEGNLIRKWFNIAEDLFGEFYYLGSSINWSPSEVKRRSEVSNIVSQISKNQGWLQSFITMYPGLRIDLEYATPAVNVCQVRSGIEFLLQGFSGISTNFDKVLNDLKVLGELEEFDDHLKVWKEGFRPDFFSGDKRTSTPKSHWWWT